MKKVYLFVYNFCTYESSPEAISAHSTMEKALKAMNEHKEKERKEWFCGENEEDVNERFVKFGANEYWGVTVLEIDK